MTARNVPDEEQFTALAKHGEPRIVSQQEVESGARLNFIETFSPSNFLEEFLTWYNLEQLPRVDTSCHGFSGRPEGLLKHSDVAVVAGAIWSNLEYRLAFQL